jgi:hypothetical protein
MSDEHEPRDRHSPWIARCNVATAAGTDCVVPAAIRPERLVPQSEEDEEYRTCDCVVPVQQLSQLSNQRRECIQLSFRRDEHGIEPQMNVCPACVRMERLAQDVEGEGVDDEGESECDLETCESHKTDETTRTQCTLGRLKYLSELSTSEEEQPHCQPWKVRPSAQRFKQWRGDPPA